MIAHIAKVKKSMSLTETITGSDGPPKQLEWSLMGLFEKRKQKAKKKWKILYYFAITYCHKNH